ncbi:hypothetical protein N7495_004181 [Penicillium taxi]|uniref:uncharacterized protein n=1 Tax=Penicillium taxi TaxID=168475 RepID=UPI0025457BDE|nr:uncharacterized protein N7495_004181 [Penicillium taxi]KAJ5899437.1 hypothetical protein N7495_004181 [Penicillium taxi]
MSRPLAAPVSFLPRNVHFWNGQTGDYLGGVWQEGSITNHDFFMMLNIILIVEVPPTALFKPAGQIIQQDGQPLSPGNYVINVTSGSITLNDEPVFRRILSHNITGREDSFTEDIRSRDKKCVLSGLPCRNWHVGIWHGFEAAHIFPIGKETLWNHGGYNRWITNTATGRHRSSINSIQNGFLMDIHLHTSFDQFHVSANPDNGYKITEFIPSSRPVDGKILDPVCRDPTNPNSVSVHLLRWHFRQSVLTTMRGAGEPSWDEDFPPGRDMMGVIRSGPLPAERMEVELFSRLGSLEFQQAQDEERPELRGSDA